jgi:murein L,D-transpeptidase YcbB/YkuD
MIRPVPRLFALAAMLAVLAACAAPPPPKPAAPPAPPPPPSFQSHLDRLGVDYRIPKRGKAILVNVPGFEVIAFEDGEPVMRSRAIVGKPADPTPILETWTSVVRFRPTWRPTPEMVRSGEYADYVRPPGPKNPLGLAAIRLEPGMLVYLHGTNRPQLYEREERALSHGCVRVEDWDRLAAWLLEVDLAEVHDHANGRRTFDMPADPIPVTMGYFTTFPDDEGRAVVHADIYRLGIRTARNP